MKKFYCNIVLVCLSLTVGHVVFAQDMMAHADALLAQYPESTITTNSVADQAIAAAEHETAYINARLTEMERDCYGKFFTNSCLYNAQEEFRQSSRKIRSVSIFANRFKRQLRADQSDAKAQQQQSK